MPTYEYECTGTGRHFEAFQPITEQPLARCPECGGPARRVIGAGGGVIVKGGAPKASGHGSGGGPALSCERDRPCCGRETRCDAPPCR